MIAFIIASAVQALLIFTDEVFFHRKRGLPKWERVGHPIDTATVLTCLFFLCLVERTPTTVMIYYGLTVVSCICITKDEWVHWKYCGGTEMWLHAMLFVSHPFLLLSAMAIWETERPLIFLTALGVSMFFIYQVVYWNFIEPRRAKQNVRFIEHSEEELYEYFGE